MTYPRISTVAIVLAGLPAFLLPASAGPTSSPDECTDPLFVGLVDAGDAEAAATPIARPERPRASTESWACRGSLGPGDLHDWYVLDQLGAASSVHVNMDNSFVPACEDVVFEAWYDPSPLQSLGGSWLAATGDACNGLHAALDETASPLPYGTGRWLFHVGASGTIQYQIGLGASGTGAGNAGPDWCVSVVDAVDAGDEPNLASTPPLDPLFHNCGGRFGVTEATPGIEAGPSVYVDVDWQDWYNVPTGLILSSVRGIGLCAGPDSAIQGTLVSYSLGQLTRRTDTPWLDAGACEFLEAGLGDTFLLRVQGDPWRGSTYDWSSWT